MITIRHAAGFALGLCATAVLADEGTIRISTQVSGTVNWELTTITAHGFDKANGFTLAVQDATKVWNVAVASTEKEVRIQEADGKMADIYVGYNNTRVDFSGQSEENDLHLYDLSNSFGGSQRFYNITTVYASNHGDSLIGSTTMANMLVGGAGDDSLWGYGAKSDTLLGADLQVISWLKLPVKHMVFLHAHKRGVRIGLGITVSFL